MALYLVPKRDGRPIVIDKAVLFVGRHPDCDVILTKSRKVSRKHCCLAQVDNDFFLRDLGSMNGVSVNGERVSGTAPVHVGDEIVIGDVAFELRADDRSRTRGAAAAARKPPVAKPIPEPPPAAPAPPPRPQPEDISQDFPVPIAEPSVDSVPPVLPGEPATLPRHTVDDSHEAPGEGGSPFGVPGVAYDDDDGSLPDV